MMTGETQPVTEAELHAWIDGELPEERIAAVERHLADRPEDAQRFERYRAQRALLARSFGPLIDQPLPDHLTPPFAPRKAAAAPPPGFGRGRVWGLALAASLLLFVAGGATGWAVRDRLGGGRAGAGDTLTTAFLADAVAAHKVFSVEVRHPIEVGVDQEAHLVSWLSKRIGRDMRCPKATKSGYELIGGRLLADAEGPAALYMYEDAAGRRITLYIRSTKSPAGTAFRFAQDGGLQALYWQDNGLALAVTGDLDRATLSAIAEEVYGALNS